MRQAVENTRENKEKKLGCIKKLKYLWHFLKKGPDNCPSSFAFRLPTYFFSSAVLFYLSPQHVTQP